MYKDKKDYAKYHEDQLGQAQHPIHPFQEFANIEQELAKHDTKKKARDAFGRERDEDKPHFYDDPLMESWQYQEIFEKA